MVKHSLHTKRGMRFFVLLYLLFSFSAANASVWCQGGECSSRLEFNSVGQCRTFCQTVDAELKHSAAATDSGLFLSNPAGGCFDSPVYSSLITPTNRTNPLSKIAAAEIDPLHLPLQPTKSFWGGRFAPLTSALRLPPLLAMTALRTVVLLH